MAGPQQQWFELRLADLAQAAVFWLCIAGLGVFLVVW